MVDSKAGLRLGIFLFLIILLLRQYSYPLFTRTLGKIFGVDPNRATPVITKADGVDYIELPTWKIILIQFLNIAGLGPVLGPLVGALYGPAALLWVVFGCIFAGAVHDFVSGMISIRYGGCSYPEIIGRNLGSLVRKFLVGFSIIFLVMVGAVFTTGPATILARLTSIPLVVWACIIFAYYICATLLPIDTIIARIYPYFAALLIFMAIALTVALFMQNHTVLPNVNFDTFTTSLHPKNLPIWPGLFIVIACGAISGFHATQSPLMARCMRSESQGRLIFYGSMIAEGLIALIWVTLGLSFYKSPEALAAVGPAPLVVKDISLKLLGSIGGTIAILGVVVLPISTGDTAFRSARLILGDTLHLNQKPLLNRLLLALPLFALGIYLACVDFNIIWRYFGWTNQTIAAICLWACSVYLARRGRFHWITSIPATFMTIVTTSFICNANIGLHLSATISLLIAIAVAAICFALFYRYGRTMPADINEIRA